MESSNIDRQAVTKALQMFKPEGGTTFSESYVEWIEKQIFHEITHCQNGSETDVKSIFNVINEVLARANESMNSVIGKNLMLFTVQKSPVAVDTTPPSAGLDGIPKENAASINKISCELSCQCSGGEDPHATTMAILQNLPNYSWDAKVVISLAAFAVKYGQFCLITQPKEANNDLATYVSLLNQSPNITKHADSLKSHLDAINNLLEAIKSVTICIFEFKDFPPQYIRKLVDKACLPVAAYWAIRSIVACSSQITFFLAMNFGDMITPTTEALEASRLVAKLTSIKSLLTSQLESLRIYIANEKKRYEDFMTPENVDSTPILQQLISIENNDKTPLLDCDTNPSSPNRIRVGIEEVLQGKTLVLLISDLDIVEEDIFALKQCYEDRMANSKLLYEIVWIPIVYSSKSSIDESRKKFKQMQPWMPWYIVADPWLLDPIAITYIQVKWKFSKELILVVLDLQDKVVCNNALNMFRIWGNGAYPFTAEMEKLLWVGKSWKLELLVKTVNQTIEDGASQGKVICLYGGIDMEWIKAFTSAAKGVAGVALAVGSPMEMVYVGNSKAKEKVKMISSTLLITADPTRIGHFWSRFESMWYSRTQHSKTTTIQNDKILQGVSRMLSFGESYYGWAIISKGSQMITVNGSTILKMFNDVNHWSGELTNGFGFMLAITGYLRNEHHCNKLTLPWAGDHTPDKLVCEYCGLPMKMSVSYSCCTN